MADSLSTRLDMLAEQLTDRERAMLSAFLIRAMNPLERMRHLDPRGLLTTDELRVLGGLPPAVQD